ncbi:hypothetical protein D9M71_579330 [compost metagenome]
MPKWCALANGEPGSARVVTRISGRRWRTASSTVSSEASCVGSGRSRCVAAISTSSLACHMRSMGVARVLIEPVKPTTSSQATVTMPSRLCRSSQRTRRPRRTRTVAKSSLRMNGV